MVTLSQWYCQIREELCEPMKQPCLPIVSSPLFPISSTLHLIHAYSSHVHSSIYIKIYTPSFHHLDNFLITHKSSLVIGQCQEIKRPLNYCTLSPIIYTWKDP
jgi:hypothetical protein